MSVPYRLRWVPVIGLYLHGGIWCIWVDRCWVCGDGREEQALPFPKRLFLDFDPMHVESSASVLLLLLRESCVCQSASLSHQDCSSTAISCGHTAHIPRRSSFPWRCRRECVQYEMRWWHCENMDTVGGVCGTIVVNGVVVVVVVGGRGGSSSTVEGSRSRRGRTPKVGPVTPAQLILAPERVTSWNYLLGGNQN